MAKQSSEPWITSTGVTLKMWFPPVNEPDRLEWWWPLHRLLRRMWFVGTTSDIHLEDFRLVGRIPRSGLADLWVYRHEGSQRELFVDDGGGSYELRPLPSDRARGRFTACSLPRALVCAGVHNISVPERTTGEQLQALMDFDGAGLVPLPSRVGAATPDITASPRRLRASTADADPTGDCEDPLCPVCGPPPRSAGAARDLETLGFCAPPPWNSVREMFQAADAREEEDARSLDGPTSIDGLSDGERVELEIAKKRERRTGFASTPPAPPPPTDASRPPGSPPATGPHRPKLRLVRLPRDPYRPWRG